MIVVGSTNTTGSAFAVSSPGASGEREAGPREANGKPIEPRDGLVIGADGKLRTGMLATVRHRTGPVNQD
jgi:hypothetical protein